jgi:hypothetical protein
MANRTYDFEITWCWKDNGNRPDHIEEITTVRSTTVPRAISKLARMLTEEGFAAEGEDKVKASELLVIDVRNHKITNAIIAHKRDLK